MHFASSSLLPLHRPFEDRGLVSAYENETPMAIYAVTYAVALMFLFFAMAGFLPAASARSSSLATVANGADTMMGQIFQGVMWAGALIIMSLDWRRILGFCVRMRSMVALSLLAPASALWSQAPSYSVRRGIFLLLGTLFAFFLLSRFAPRELAQILVLAGVGAGLLGMFVSIFLPAIGRDSFNSGAWQGIFRSKNGCAQVMLFFLTPAVVFNFHSRFMGLMRYILFALAAILILMSNAKTAWILAPGYILLMSIASWTRRLRRRDALLIVLGGIGLLAIVAAAIPCILPVILGALGKDRQLSGRVPLWATSLVSFAKHPLLGYGYQAFWTGMSGESLNVYMTIHFEIYQAQNGLLEVALELGLVGVGLVLLTLVSAVRDALVCFRYAHSAVVNWYVGILALSISYNIDETFLASAHSLPWLLYVLACTGLAVEARKVRALRAGLAVTPLYTQPTESISYQPLTHEASR
jgi:exopolysaccharide production protein ExoQ